MPSSLNSTLRLLYWEGAFAMAYETWIGPTYLSGLAGELGLNVGILAFLTALPWIGSIGQLFGTWTFQHFASVKKYCLGLAALSRALWTLPLIAAFLWRSEAGTGANGFPVERWFWLVALLACASALVGYSSTTAWMSWIKGLMPSEIHGRFFGTRQRATMAGILVANLLGAVLVGWKPQGEFLGYAILGGLALVSAVLSTFLLARVPDLAPNQKPKALFHSDTFKVFLEPLRDPAFRPVLILGAAFNGAMHIAGPYFPYYFTSELKIPMSTVSIWLALSNLGCFAAAAFWGRRIDRTGDLKGILRFTGTLIALSPLPYLIPSAEIIRWIGPGEYFINGAAHVGYQVAFWTLLFRACPKDKNAVYFSVYAAAMGVTGATSTFLGGHLAEWLAPWGGFRALWLIGTTLRLLVIWTLLEPIGRRVSEPALTA